MVPLFAIWDIRILKSMLYVENLLLRSSIDFLSFEFFKSFLRDSTSSDLQVERVRTNVDHVIWPNGKRVVLIAEVKLIKLDRRKRIQ